MVVLAVNKGDLDRQMGQLASGVESREASADYHDFGLCLTHFYLLPSRM
jgi:hypothetical protein